ncbi:MAG TPA: AAA family ATPase, partial [Jiangellaceae bacterium]
MIRGSPASEPTGGTAAIPRDGPAAGSSLLPAPPSRELAAPEFSGRAREVRLLSRALESPPAAVLVEGEAGIGKSRLIHEVLRKARLRALVATCPPYREPSTLAPIVDVLQQARPDISKLPLTGLAGALRPLFPEWADDLPPAPEPLDDVRASRHRLFRALAGLVDTLGAAVLVVDDVHWADDATLDFLLFLASRRQARPMSLVATYRPEDLADTSLVRRLPTAFPAGTTHVRVTLRPLDQPDTAAMISSMLGGDRVSEAFAGFMHTHTDGVPLAVEESMRLLGDRAFLVRRGGAWVRRGLDELQVPPTVRDATLERTRRLPPAAQRVLEAVAVLGAAGEAVVADVTDLPVDEARARLAEAFARGLLAEPKPGQVTFRHTLMGRTIYQAIPEPDRRRLHLAAGVAIERSEPRALAELTRHFKAAGDTARWAAYAEQAADRAIESGDHTTAVALLHDLLSAAELSSPDLVRVARTVATAALARSDAVDELHHRVVQTLRDVLDSPGLTPMQQAEIRNPLGRLLINQGDGKSALAELEQAVEHIVHHPLEAARAMTYLGWAFAGPWPASTHRQWLRRAEVAATRVRSPDDRLSLAGDRAAALLMLGDSSAFDLVSALPLDVPPGAESRTVARINTNLGKGAIVWGRYAEARSRLAAALTLAEAGRLTRLRFSILLAQADLDWYTGRWDGLAQRVAELADADRDRPVAYLATVRLAARLDAAAGRLRAAHQQYRLALDEATRLGALDDTMEPSAALARRFLAEGRPDDALQITDAPIRTVHTKRVWVWATELAPARVEALLAAGRPEDAARLVATFARGLRGRAAPAPRVALSICRATLAAADGDQERATAAFGRAAHAWDALPRPYDALLARERQASALMSTGREDAAADLLSEVHTGFLELGATGDADRVRRQLGSHRTSVQQWRGGRRGYGEQLSPREIEVVQLVVAGKTNRQIARRLSKSPRTVEGQIRSAMR